MKKITQAEYDALPIVNGRPECPGNTDYSDITRFGNYASFGINASFGDHASFGINARFGNYTRFGINASFGDHARFGNYTCFGINASFGDHARFGINASFGDRASFGIDAGFGINASFGIDARFEDIDSKSKRGNPLLQFDRIGSRNGRTQFFNLECGIWVRCGCQLLSLDDFRTRVQNTYGQEGHGLIYLGLANVAEEYFKQEDERAKS